MKRGKLYLLLRVFVVDQNKFSFQERFLKYCNFSYCNIFFKMLRVNKVAKLIFIGAAVIPRFTL